MEEHSSKIIETLPEGSDRSEFFRRLLISQIGYIERQCEEACLKANYPYGIDADTLFNEVLERLSERDYERLRNFRNRSKIQTYLAVIISSVMVDLIREKAGRSRSYERAKEYGRLGELLYELVFKRNYTKTEAYQALKTTYRITETFDEVSDLIDKIRGKRVFTEETIQDTSTSPQDELTEIKDTALDPCNSLLKKEKEGVLKETLKEVLSQLSAEERLLIRMRFPLNEEERPLELDEIGNLLGITKKAVDSRLRRILSKCREHILKNGLSLDDLL